MLPVQQEESVRVHGLGQNSPTTHHPSTHHPSTCLPTHHPPIYPPSIQAPYHLTVQAPSF